MKEKKITDLDILNMDKTGFRMSCGKAQLIVTINPNKLFYMIDLKNRNYITLAKCIGSAGEIIPPMLVIFGVNILYK